MPPDPVRTGLGRDGRNRGTRPRPRGAGRMALTRAMTPEMNTVGLGGLRDKKGERVQRNDSRLTDGPGGLVSGEGNKRRQGREEGAGGRPLPLYYFAAVTAWPPGLGTHAESSCSWGELRQSGREGDRSQRSAGQLPKSLSVSASLVTTGQPRGSASEFEHRSF